LITELTATEADIVWDIAKPNGQPHSFGFTAKTDFREAYAEQLIGTWRREAKFEVGCSKFQNGE
jgi:hypothetical protein